MENVVQERIHHDNRGRNPFSLGVLYRCTVQVLLISFYAAIILIWLIGHYAIPQSRPFDGYSDIFPRRPVNDIKLRGYTCFSAVYPEPPADTCTINPTTGTFTRIGVILSDGVVRHITFIVRKNELRLGDLVMLMGEPEMRSLGRSRYFLWRTNGAMALTISSDEPSSLFIPIWTISFTDLGLPQ